MLRLGSRKFFQILILLLLANPAITFATTIIFDPIGDVASGPDIESFSGSYDASSVYLNLKFASGTLDPQNFSVGISLKTDNGDYSISIDRSPAFMFGGITLFSGPSGLVPYVFPITVGEDNIFFKLLLSVLGDNDGVLLFSAYASVNEIFTLGGAPSASPPIDTIGAGVTTPVSEPSTLMLMIGLVPGMLFWLRKQP